MLVASMYLQISHVLLLSQRLLCICLLNFKPRRRRGSTFRKFPMCFNATYLSTRNPVIISKIPQHCTKDLLGNRLSKNHLAPRSMIGAKYLVLQTLIDGMLFPLNVYVLWLRRFSN